MGATLPRSRDGAIEISTESEGTLLVRRWSFWRNHEFGPGDLIDYLSPDGLLERATNRILSAWCCIHVYGSKANRRLVRQTYVGNLDQDIQCHAAELTARSSRDCAGGAPARRLVTEDDLDALPSSGDE
jgi:hypothetical protein